MTQDREPSIVVGYDGSDQAVDAVALGRELTERHVNMAVPGHGDVGELDVVHGLADRGADLLSLKLADVMTRNVVTCDPADTVDQLMAEMTNRRIRHFPVVQDGRLCGIVSIGDVVKNRLDEVEYEARSLRSFIAGA